MTILAKVQIEALRRSKNLEGYIYAMEPGLGKTLTVLVEFYRLHRAKKIDIMLVICPNSLVGTWRYEIQKHGLNELLPIVYITNYEGMIYSTGQTAIAWAKRGKLLLVLDESSKIKNFNSAVTKFIQKEISPYAKYTRLLNGTPILENPMSLFPQMRIIGATPGTNPYVWRARWCKMGGFKGKQFKAVKDPEKLAAFCAPHMFVASKEEWADDLPSKTFSRRVLEMSPMQKKLYRDIRTEFFAEHEGKEITAPMVLTVMAKLSQISCGFIINDEKRAQLIELDNSKIQAALDIIEERPNQKVVIVCVNLAAIEIFKSGMNKAGLRTIEIYGGIDVDAAKETFNNDDSIRVCILGEQTGAMGLTLLGSATTPCSTMIFAQINYSQLLFEQIQDRIHRIGAKYPCQYFFLIASASDQAVVKSLEGKTNMSEEILTHLRGDNV